jgi:F-type H+-transporting ATPase subunit gamma
MRTLQLLDAAVLAMKSLSAHHFRLARAALVSVREYRTELEHTAAGIVPFVLEADARPPLLIVIGADLGLCAEYHARLLEAAQKHAHELRPESLDCIGRRTAALLTRREITVRRTYAAPSSVDDVTRTLLDVVDSLLSDFASGRFGSVHVVAARSLGVGEFDVVRTRLLPLEALTEAGPPLSRYVSNAHFDEVAMRERLFIGLLEVALDAMASEHGTRLLAAQGASEWLDRELAQARRQLSALRQEAGTQEVLELVMGAIRRRGYRARRLGSLRDAHASSSHNRLATSSRNR